MNYNITGGKKISIGCLCVEVTKKTPLKELRLESELINYEFYREKPSSFSSNVPADLADSSHINYLVSVFAGFIHC